MSESLRLIKKYPNRRLYDTKTSAYITLNDVKGLVLSFEAFKVVDAKTDEDLTRAILLQIIIEEEAAGVPLFTTELLAQMIRLYGHATQGALGKFLEANIGLLQSTHGQARPVATHPERTGFGADGAGQSSSADK